VTHVLTDGERTGWLNVYHRPEGESIFPSFQTLHGHRPDFSVMKYSTVETETTGRYVERCGKR